MDARPKRSPVSEAIDHHVRFVGGSAAVTKVTDTGQGMTTTYISTGVVELTWAENPGVYVDARAQFHATTPADVKSYVAVFGAYNATTFKLRVYMYESGTLTDLAALEWLGATVTFKRSGTGV